MKFLLLLYFTLTLAVFVSASDQDCINDECMLKCKTKYQSLYIDPVGGVCRGIYGRAVACCCYYGSESAPSYIKE